MRVWPFMPQREFTETLEWLGEILQAKNSEQRLSLRTLPRWASSFQYVMDNHMLAVAQALVASVGGDEVMVPLWNYVDRLGGLAAGSDVLAVDAAHAEYVVGGSVMVWSEFDRFEEAVVASVGSTSVTLASPVVGDYANAYACPMRRSRFSQSFDAQRGSSDWMTARAYFKSVYTGDLGAPSPAYPTYRGQSVMDDRNVLVSDVSDKVVREVETVDSVFGTDWTSPTMAYLTSSTAMGWYTLGRAELWRLRQWLMQRNGRQVGFWLPTWNRDLTPMANISSADTSLLVADLGYSAAYQVRDVQVVSTSGAVHRLRVMYGEPGSPGTELLHLESAAGFTLAQSDVESVSFLDFARLDADRVEISHKAARGASVVVPIAKVPAP